MPKEFVITMTAANRVGILAAVSNAMLELGGDLLETRQTVVRGFFTMIFAARFPDERDAQLIRDHLQGVCAPFGIDLGVKDPTEETLPAETPQTEIEITISGTNQRGLLHRIAKQFSLFGADIVSMRAVCSADGESFTMPMTLALPVGTEPGPFLNDVQEMGREHRFSLVVEPQR